MTDLEWYVADHVDESCPPAKARPEEFAFFDGDRWQLGYAPSETGILDEDRAWCNRALAVGDIVDFMSCERLPGIEATLRRDGTFELHGALPSGYNVVIVNGDSDLLYETFDDLMQAIKVPEHWCPAHELIFEDGADTARVELSFATWSDPLPHVFEVHDGHPAFSLVPAGKN